MDSTETEEPLRGTTRAVYRYLLKNSKPTGAREIQKKLNLSSPSLAAYHLSKLEEIGLVRKENGGFIIDRVILEDIIKVKSFLIPRYLFYSVFATLALMLELTLFRSALIISQYFFFVAITLACTLIFWFETVKTWMKSGL
jgi:DNA-binding transcriptional ArsR family regulator